MLFVFMILFYAVLAIVFHCNGCDAAALISFTAATFFVAMFLFDKSENK